MRFGGANSYVAVSPGKADRWSDLIGARSYEPARCLLAIEMCARLNPGTRRRMERLDDRAFAGNAVLAIDKAGGVASPLPESVEHHGDAAS